MESLINISPPEDIIADIKAGKMVILTDEEDRENEGDLVLAAEFATPEAINFMAKYGRGLICLTLTDDMCKQLNLPMMVGQNGSVYHTNFTVSIEAAEGVTTGISAADRAHTILTAIKPNAQPSDIVQPGHIFPIRAVNGGVLMRAGHTEAGCDLAQLANLTPAAVICEIMNDDGTMARMPDLMVFAKNHQLKIGTIADLIHYRSKKESIINRIGEKRLQTPFGEFTAYLYQDRPSQQIHMALQKGSSSDAEVTTVRVHEPFTPLDLLSSDAGVHSWPIQVAMQEIQKSAHGVVVLLNCVDDAQILINQFTRKPENPPPKRKMDFRTYGVGAQILMDLGVRKMCILASPRRMPSMTGYGLEIVSYRSAPHEDIIPV